MIVTNRPGAGKTTLSRKLAQRLWMPEPKRDGKVKTSSHLDRIPETNTVITEQNGQIVATISIMADNSFGLPIDNYFKEETDAIRANSGDQVGVIWRIASSKECRRNKHLIMDTIAKVTQLVYAS